MDITAIIGEEHEEQDADDFDDIFAEPNIPTSSHPINCSCRNCELKFRKASDGKGLWAVSTDGIFSSAGNTTPKLPAGFYRPGAHPQLGATFNRQTVSTDSLVLLPDMDVLTIVEEFKVFWDLGKKFKEYGFLHKRGVLLWGDPGSGKSSMVQILSQHLIKELGGIIVLVDGPGVTTACLQMLRSIEPHRPVICVLEDLDALVEKHGEMSFLSLLDGEAQVDNIVFVATCFTPETRMLTADLRWVPCGDLKIGDELWGFDEDRPKGRGARRRYRPSVVTMSHPARKECVRVTLDTGESFICTTDHPWLSSMDNQQKSFRLDWTVAKDLMKSPNLVRPFMPWKTETSWEAGWLAGILDGEGCVQKSGTEGVAAAITVSQNSGPTADRIHAAMALRGDVKHYQRSGKHSKQETVYTRGGVAATAKLIGQVRAERLIERFDLSNGFMHNKFPAKVISVEPVGMQTIQSIQTSTHTYIAEGFASHNTNYPKKLDKRFLDRPSRFDRVLFIGMPDVPSRKAYLETKAPSLKGAELDNWVAISKGYSIAHLREMMVGVFCFGYKVEDVVERINRMRRPESTNDPAKGKFGFGSEK